MDNNIYGDYKLMPTDKEIELLNDAVEGLSNCCGAKVMMDICLECKEHCGIAPAE